MNRIGVMAASSTSSWLHTSLLSPTVQQQSAQHTLYGADLPIHPSTHLVAAHQQQQAQHQPPQHTNVVVGHEARQPCDGFCNPVQCALNLDFHHTAESQELHDFSRPAGGSCNGTVGAGNDSGGRVSARKMHKADREKLRRDRLNEQFADLAGVLDPDRPKHDKATILGDSVQAVREIRSEVKRLRTEQASLSEESRDLAQEKGELREEKATLKNETENLQDQLRQRIRLMIPWMGMDPSAMMMGGAPCAYPMAVPQSVSAPPTSDMNQTVSQSQVGAPLPAYMPLGPTAPPGAYAVHHPGLQGYPMYAATNRPGDGSMPYLPYPHYPPPPVVSHSHVERPFPQYASPMHPLPGYLMQMQPPPHPGQPTMSISGAPPPVPSAYQSFPPPGMPFMAPLPRPQPSLPGGGQPKGVTMHPAPAVATPEPGSDLASRLQPHLEQPGTMPSVQTTLQLQTPLYPQPQGLSQANRPDEVEGSTDGQNGAAASPALGLLSEGQSAVRNSTASGVQNSASVSSLSTGSAGACSPGLAPTSNREPVAAAHSKKDVGDPQLQATLEIHDPTLRPPVA